MDAYVINTNYSNLADELIKYIKVCPNNFQAKVLACLDFLSIKTFGQIMGHIHEDPEKVLKSLMLSEKNGLTVHMNGGWILRLKPKAEFLNKYLSLDINSNEISLGKKNKKLLKSLPEVKDNTVLNQSFTTVIKKTNEPQCISETYTGGSLYIYRNEDLNPERPMTGGGRSKSKEFTDVDALALNREVANTVKNINEAHQKEKIQNKITNTPKPTKEQISVEKIRAFLTINYPDYESLIDLRYNEDSTLPGMMQLYAEIIKRQSGY